MQMKKVYKKKCSAQQLQSMYTTQKKINYEH